MPEMKVSNFKRLIGVWETEGTIFSDKGHLKLVGIDSYELILGGNYILHKAAVTMAAEKSETFEIILLDGSIDKATMHYYNSKAETGVMESSLTENNFKIKGDKLKFEGTINDDNTKLFGKWYLQKDNHEWNEFIDLKLTKQR